MVALVGIDRPHIVVCSHQIIDGQQRLTSLTLFLIYLHNLQKEQGFNEKIEPMIFSELRGSKSFNITVEERIPCLENLFNQGSPWRVKMLSKLCN